MEEPPFARVAGVSGRGDSVGLGEVVRGEGQACRVEVESEIGVLGVVV